MLTFLELDPSKAQATVEGSSTFDPEAECWKKRATQPIDSANVQRWRTEMSNVHKYLFDRLLGPQLDWHGYPRAQTALRQAGTVSVAHTLAIELLLMARRAPVAIARALRLTRRQSRTEMPAG